MSELRWHPILREWVITATHRQDRTFLPPRDVCPLCPTRVGSAPTEIARADFDVAVFDNRFPSLQADPPQPEVAGTDATPVRPAVGASEVVVYTPEHDASLGELSVDHVRRLIAVWAHRTGVLGARPDVDYVYVFENRGEAVGVTLHHPHGQIYGYPFTPPLIERELAAGRDHADRSGGCLWCAHRRQEADDGRRWLFDAGGWGVFVPFFARWPYEVHLVPERHLGALAELDGAELDGLAGALGSLVRRYDALFGFPLPYVMAVHQRPTDGESHESYHLHLELYPPHRAADKLKYLAGSEAGAGAFITDALPEETAARLRALAG
jgi:UDPglucose--hexose-1-phosphate uridylyltransferase